MTENEMDWGPFNVQPGPLPNTNSGEVAPKKKRGRPAKPGQQAKRAPKPAPVDMAYEAKAAAAMAQVPTRLDQPSDVELVVELVRMLRPLPLERRHLVVNAVSRLLS